MKRTYIQPSAKSIAIRGSEHLLTESNDYAATAPVGGKPGSFDVKGMLDALIW